VPIPTPIVEIAFDDSPYTNTVTWTDVTTYVRSIETSRGRTDDFADFDTGTANVVLSNNSRLFDPFYTAGTYFGKLLPRRQIRIRATSGGTTYDIFRGFVSGWPVTYTNSGKDSTVTLQCFDALGLLASEQVSDDNYQTAILSISPRRYWKCNETTETTVLVDQIGGVNLTKTSGLPFQPTTSLLQGCTGSAAAMVEYGANGGGASTPSGLVFSFIGKPTVANDTGNFVAYECGQMAFQVNVGAADGSALFQFISGATIYELTIPAGTFNPTIPHHYLFIASTSPTKLLIDGVAPTQTFVSSAFPASGANERAIVENMEIQEFFVKHATTTTPVFDAEEFNALATGFNYRANTYDRNQYLLGQTPFIRYDYSTNYVQVPYITAPNGVRVLRIENSGDLLPQLKTNADTEGGEMFAKKDGRILFTDRNYKYTSTKSANIQATFSDAGGATLKYGTELQLDYDADSIRNSVTVNYSAGASADNNVIAINTTSTASVGKVADTINTYLATETDASSLANLQLGVGAALKPRISPLEVGLTDTTADWQTILGLELLERIKLVRTPSVGSNIELVLLINQIEHSMTPGEHRTTIIGSVRFTGWFTLDVSALDGTDILV
jgi:hypothetical protein